ncbi:methylenetetrahydrofolate reductase C-terminal domain-containing protein [Intestinibacter sp.]|uniref:methylenetetrahydrofolate reductase C-terminal domain-containing protein n=1 Tax=Intestinibacter sp. TaxID=1965304 RepID=UPI002A74CBCA|nr:methylenetetrahydrofolate reductase C-terminal domain-containing protein [Intestinibacter sp.]MDY2737661.1 methylenetetrahydrofolate reductase C-terminal domain-containing protein [Intestinibacter sp.]MDY4574031.1 methylenetetrahydrofolate reductase C-terminal domain-containing protein [Intestinibacter sp.]
MVVSEKKPIEELLGYLKGAKKVVLVGCGDCASACKTGGEPEIAEMKETLAANGIEVTGSVIIPTACNLLLGKKELKAVKDALKEADAVVSMACGDGTQTIMKNVKKQNIPVYPANDTLFIGEVERVGKFEEACKACGECELGWTGGICPVTMCAKGLVNGACGGAKNGKCEVSPDNDCAWVLIYERLKALGQLDNMKEVRAPKDYSKQLNPRRHEVGKKAEAQA